MQNRALGHSYFDTSPYPRNLQNIKLYSIEFSLVSCLAITFASSSDFPSFLAAALARWYAADLRLAFGLLAGALGCLAVGALLLLSVDGSVGGAVGGSVVCSAVLASTCASKAWVSATVATSPDPLLCFLVLLAFAFGTATNSGFLLLLLDAFFALRLGAAAFGELLGSGFDAELFGAAALRDFVLLLDAFPVPWLSPWLSSFVSGTFGFLPLFWGRVHLQPSVFPLTQKAWSPNPQGLESPWLTRLQKLDLTLLGDLLAGRFAFSSAFSFWAAVVAVAPLA